VWTLRVKEYRRARTVGVEAQCAVSKAMSCGGRVSVCSKEKERLGEDTHKFRGEAFEREYAEAGGVVREDGRDAAVGDAQAAGEGELLQVHEVRGECLERTVDDERGRLHGSIIRSGLLRR
jgi:hypothetical protein